VFLHDNCEQISFVIFFAFLKKEEMKSGTHFTQQNVFLLFTVVVTKHVWPYLQSRFPKTSSERVSSCRRHTKLSRDVPPFLTLHSVDQGASIPADTPSIRSVNEVSWLYWQYQDLT